MELVDLIASLAYITLIVLIALFVRSYFKYSEEYRRFFLKGLGAKLLGGIAFAMVYTYYYSYGGDSRTYFHDAQILLNILTENPIDYFNFIVRNNDFIRFNYDQELQYFIYKPGQSEWFTVKLASIAVILGISSYLASTILFAMFSFIGIWHLFLVFSRRYPEIKGQIAFAVLFVPSVFFWGSGIMKDSIVIGFLGMLIYYADVLIRKKGIKKILPLLKLLICAYVIFSVKAYVIMSLIPAILLWVILNYKDRIKSKLIRRTIVPFLIVLSMVAISVVLQFLGTFNEKYSLDNVLQTAQGMQNWHYVEGDTQVEQFGRGSSYTLGDYDATILGTLSKFFPAVNVTLFRPYLWEVSNIGMLAAAIESSMVLFFTVFIVIRLGFFKVIKIINEDSFLLMSIAFSIFFAFAIGFTSYNFGALVRYKIPCMPFFLCSLFILLNRVKEIKTYKRSQIKKSRRR